MTQRRPILAALLLAMLMVSISPSVAQTSRGQEADTACASPALGAVADRVAEAFDDHPFFVGSRDFPSTQAWPDDLFYADDGPLERYIDALIYLGPEADRTLSKPLDLTEAQHTELRRRAPVKSAPGLLETVW